MPRARAPGVLLHTAANGFAHVTTLSRARYAWLSLLLHFRHAFWRWGSYVPPVADESIHPTFIRGRLRLLAGWDHWLGYYLLATDPESSEFLRAFFQKHCTRGSCITMCCSGRRGRSTFLPGVGSVFRVRCLAMRRLLLRISWRRKLCAVATIGALGMTSCESPTRPATKVWSFNSGDNGRLLSVGLGDEIDVTLQTIGPGQ